MFCFPCSFPPSSPLPPPQGLAFPELSEMQVNPAFFNMMRQDVLDRDLFALWLSASPTLEPAGALTFGHADPDHYTGPVTWIPVTEKAYWTVALGGVAVGGRSVPLSARGATAPGPRRLPTDTVYRLSDSARRGTLGRALITSHQYSYCDVLNHPR